MILLLNHARTVTCTEATNLSLSGITLTTKFRSFASARCYALEATWPSHSEEGVSVSGPNPPRHESLDVTLAYLKGKDAESEEGGLQMGSGTTSRLGVRRRQYRTAA